MDQDKDVEHELGDAEGVWVGGTRLHAVQGLAQAGHMQKAVDPDQRRVDVKAEVEEVRGQQGTQVQFKNNRAQVALLQLRFVLDQDALLQVSCREQHRSK